MTETQGAKKVSSQPLKLIQLCLLSQIQRKKNNNQTYLDKTVYDTNQVMY